VIRLLSGEKQSVNITRTGEKLESQSTSNSRLQEFKDGMSEMGAQNLFELQCQSRREMWIDSYTLAMKGDFSFPVP
jgi:hypothetical protein